MVSAATAINTDPWLLQLRFPRGAGSSLLPGCCLSLQWCECYRKKGKGQGGFGAMPVSKSRKRTVEVMGGLKVIA